jgi:hypothetical protein
VAQAPDATSQRPGPGADLNWVSQFQQSTTPAWDQACGYTRARKYHIGPFDVNRLRPPTLALMSPPSPRAQLKSMDPRALLPIDSPISSNPDARDVGSGYPSGLALLAQLVEHLHGKEGVDGSSPSEGSYESPA